ncbi:hypothetical protein F1C10_07720 [Sphingomonas sp. NBWT7]|uniref:hypothetical protein n=1 Tax=Sphingomonas sp. NBWT7 TaxID=2596913 RepID=UPI0016270CBF|nr:hypothetical protein [Sphingomonas sp. NBWT7]QNE31832.1 hypothetical protein F1C10_07720 [Sphingomonas sp. NBWT7]
MTAAYRLKGLGWFGGVVIVSLSFYLVSLQVAAERKRLAQVDAKISAAERDIRALETEFDVRANLAQLERWNGDTLALVAPTAGQFVRDEGQLAAISFRPGQPGFGAGEGDVRTAQLIVPSRLGDVVPTAPAVIDEAPAAAPATLVKVAARTPAPRPTSVRVAMPVTQPRAQEQLGRVAAIKAVAMVSAPPAASIRKARAVAMLDKSLLSDTTLGDLLSGARSETSRLR